MLSVSFSDTSTYMGVSWNRGTPKSSILVGFPSIHFWVSPLMEAPRKLFSVSFNRVFSVIGAGRYLGPTLAWQQLGPHGGAQNIPQSTVKLAGLDCSPIHVTGHWMGLNHFYLAVICGVGTERSSPLLSNKPSKRGALKVKSWFITPSNHSYTDLPQKTYHYLP